MVYAPDADYRAVCDGNMDIQKKTVGSLARRGNAKMLACS